MLLSKLVGINIIKNTLLFSGFLIFIFSFDNLLKTFDKVINGELIADRVLTIFLFLIPISFPIIIPLSVFLAVLISLSQMYSNQEFVILTSAGYSPFKILINILKYMMIVVIVMVVFAFFLTPRAIKTTLIIFEQIKTNISLDNIASNKFYKISNGFYFLINGNKYNSNNNIFVYKDDNNENWQTNYILASNLEQQVNIDYQRFLSFKQGQLYRISYNENSYSSFNSALIRNDVNYNLNINKVDSLSISELLKNVNPSKKSELHWRIAQPLMIIVLTLMAFALSYSKPRVNKFSKILPAIAIFLLYLGLIIYQIDLIKKNENNKIYIYYVYFTHFCFALGSIILIFKSHHMFSIKRLLDVKKN